MKDRIQRERNTFRKIVSVNMPRNFVNIAREIQNVLFVIETDRGNGLCFQGSEQLFGLGAKLLSHTI